MVIANVKAFKIQAFHMWHTHYSVRIEISNPARNVTASKPYEMPVYVYMMRVSL